MVKGRGKEMINIIHLVLALAIAFNVAAILAVNWRVTLLRGEMRILRDAIELLDLRKGKRND